MKINWEVDGKTWTIDREINEVEGMDELEIVFDESQCFMSKADVAKMVHAARLAETGTRKPATLATFGIKE